MREEQIEQAAFKYLKTQYGFIHEKQEGFIQGAKWAQEQSQWISVADRLPENSGWYLVSFPNVQVSFFYIEPDYKGEHHKFTDKYVTHWMPLPEPPKQ